MKSVNYKVLYNQMVEELLDKADKARARKHSFYHKKGGYVSWGVSATDFGLVMKKYKKQLRKLKGGEVLDFAQLFYRSGVEDEIYAGNFITAMHAESFTSSDIRFFDEVLNYFHTWGTIDDFCVHTLEALLRKFPKQTVLLLEKWNRSKNIWKRRASVVAFTRKIGESGKFTNEGKFLTELQLLFERWLS